MLPFHSIASEESLRQLGSSMQGLSTAEAEERLRTFGPNALPEARPPSVWSIFLDQLMSPIVYLLVFAAVASVFFEDYTEAGAIVLVILVNAIIGFIMEYQATRSMEALRKLDESYAKVFRNGMLTSVNSKALVPGDLIYVEGGEIIAADARIVESINLELDESPLTGESFPVAKGSDLQDEDTPQSSRVNMLFKGTAVSKGNGKAVVTGTGQHTELGKIADMVNVARQEEPPLNKRLDQLGKKLIWLVGIIALPFLAVGLWQERDLYLMIETAIALAVAAIPEGLPIVATIALARGMLSLARQQVVIKKLAAVETLGSANIVLTDKTGTLTENALTIHSLILPDGTDVEVDWEEGRMQLQALGTGTFVEQEIAQLAEIGFLCNNAVIEADGTEIGDPLEVALLQFHAGYEQHRSPLQDKAGEKIAEIPFDSDTKVMGTMHRDKEGYYVATKGAVEAVLDRCTSLQDGAAVRPLTEADKKEILQRADVVAGQGMKVLAYACKHLVIQEEDFLDELIFAGMTGFLDPPRPGVREAIQECQDAGINVVMVTGDHFETARAIAAEVGLGDDGQELVGLTTAQLATLDLNDPAVAQKIEQTTFFSRVTPAQKLDLVDFYQKKGYIVGMTGDGINDAPALKKAEIGIAMGKRGTQVACEAADMILKEDSFSSLVLAIKQGRAIYNNVKNFIIYLLSCNLAEIMIVAVAAFSNLALPLLPLQILFLNLVTDVFPALALGMGKGSPHLMKIKPRLVDEPIITRENWWAIISYSLIMTLSVLAVFLYSLFGLGHEASHANTLVFFALSFAQLVHPLSLIPAEISFFRNTIVRNKYLWMAVALCLLLLMVVYLIPFAQELLSLVDLDGQDWLLVLAAGIIPVIIIRIAKYLKLIG